jgi:flagellar hook-associated protein 1 FlgK
MSSLSDILSIASSGLRTAQTVVSLTSDNIANVNTAGYSRKIANQTEVVANGAGVGVNVSTIARAANQYLDAASLQATSGAASSSAISSYLDQAQTLFGDPSTSNSFFSGLDSIYSAFTTASATPSSNLSRSDALTAVNTFLSNAGGISTSLNNLQNQTTQQINSDVTTVNGILSQLSSINGDISRISVSGGDASGSQNTQSQLLNQLAGLMQVQVHSTATGGVTVRSADGTALVGPQGAATLAYSTSGAAGIVTATPQGGTPQQVRLGSGEISGLVQLGSVDLPQISSQLGNLVSKAVDQINAAHNGSTALPPPTTLTGSNVGMALDTAIAGFSGKTTIAVTDSTGVLQKTVAVSFSGSSGGTISVNGAAPTAFTTANFMTSLNTALGASGSASFTNGVLSLSATGTNGVAISDDAVTPSAGANGEGFSQFFGLNNLIQSSGSSNYATGLSLSSPNTFATGGTLSLQIQDSTGAAVRKATLTIPATAATVGDVINGLNTSVGAYGSFSLDSTGQLSFTPAANSGVTLSVASDNTANSVGGLSLSQTFGIGAAVQASRTNGFSLRSDIAADPSKMALASVDLTQTVGGNPAIGSGDGSGATAIAASGSSLTSFAAAGDMAAMKVSVSDYAAELSGQIGNKASNADTASQAAAATSTQVNAQRSSAEGVNMDEELVNLTTYQQSYNACSRLIQASSDMFNTLLQMI